MPPLRRDSRKTSDKRARWEARGGGSRLAPRQGEGGHYPRAGAQRCRHSVVLSLLPLAAPLTRMDTQVGRVSAVAPKRRVTCLENGTRARDRRRLREPPSAGRAAAPATNSSNVSPPSSHARSEEPSHGDLTSGYSPVVLGLLQWGSSRAPPGRVSAVCTHCMMPPMVLISSCTRTQSIIQHATTNFSRSCGDPFVRRHCHPTKLLRGSRGRRWVCSRASSLPLLAAGRTRPATAPPTATRKVHPSCTDFSARAAEPYRRVRVHTGRPPRWWLRGDGGSSAVFIA